MQSINWGIVLRTLYSPCYEIIFPHPEERSHTSATSAIRPSLTPVPGGVMWHLTRVQNRLRVPSATCRLPEWTTLKLTPRLTTRSVNKEKLRTRGLRRWRPRQELKECTTSSNSSPTNFPPTPSRRSSWW